MSQAPDAAVTKKPETAQKREDLGVVRLQFLKHPVVVIFTFAFLIRLTLALAVDHLFDGALVQPDALTYHDMSAAAAVGATGSWDDFTHQLYAATATYLRPLTFLYATFGSSLSLGGAYAAVLGAANASLVAAIASRVWNARVALVAGGILALLPSHALWSSVTLKDPMVWLLVSGVAYCTLRFLRVSAPRNLPWIVGGIGLLLLLGYTRQHTMIVACLALPIAALAGKAEGRFVRFGCASIIAVCLPWVLGLGPAGFTFATKKDISRMRLLNAVGANTAVVDVPREMTDAAYLEKRLDMLLARAAALRERAASDPNQAEELKEQADALAEEAGRLSAGYATTEDGSLAPDIAHLPRGISVMLLEPYPWQSSSSTPLNLARAETLIWYPLVALGFIGLLNLRRYADGLLYPATFGAGILILYALTEGNLGTAYRHRGEFVWVVVLLAAGAIHRRGWIR